MRAGFHRDTQPPVLHTFVRGVEFRVKGVFMVGNTGGFRSRVGNAEW